MPNGGKGAIAKIYVETEVIDNFKQQAAKIKSGLGNGLKDLKDLDLKFGFDEKSMAEAASKELDAMMNIMTSKKLEKLDFSGIVPNMVSFLNDDSIADTVKLQIVQGLRLGLESFSSTASSIDIKTLMRGDGNTVFSNILGYTSIQDILKSFDFTKQKSNLLNKQFNTTMGLSVGKDKEGFAKDIAQLLSLKATYDDPRYKEVSQYLISGTYRKGDKDVSMFQLQTLSELLDPYVMQKRGEEGTLTPKVVEDIAGYLERMKYLGDIIQLNAGEGAPINAVLDQYNSIVEDKNYAKFMEYIGNDPKLSAIFNDTRKKVAEASRYKDAQYAQIDWRSFATDINDALARLIMGAGKDGAMGRLLPTIQGWESDQKQFTADELLSETIRSISVESEDNGLRQDYDYAERAEKAAGRAEKAAGRAEDASEKAVKAAEDIKKITENKSKDKKTNDKSSSSKPSNGQETNETAERMADSAEADSENTKQLTDALEQKKKQIEEDIINVKNKVKELKDANQRYRDAIDSNFDEIQTPEEALTQFQAKGKQLQEIDQKYKEIDKKKSVINGQIAFKDGQDAIEYEKILGQYYQALIEYRKAGQAAMDKGVSPVDIIQNSIDENYLDFNYQDGQYTMEDYIAKLKEIIQKNDQNIVSLKEYVVHEQQQLEELQHIQEERPQNQNVPVSHEDDQSHPRSDTNAAQEEIEQTQKTRKDLEDERKKLQEEVQKASKSVEEAQNTLSTTNASINQLEGNIKKRNKTLSHENTSKTNLETDAQKITEELQNLRNSLQVIREKKEQAKKELEKFEEESDILSSSKEYMQKVENEGSLNWVNKHINELQVEYKAINEKIEELNNLIETPPEMPTGKSKAFEYFKEMAIANQEAQRDYERWFNDDWSDIETPENLNEEELAIWNKQLEDRKKNAFVNSAQAYLNYQRAWANAMEEGVEPSKINRYLGDQYDPNRVLPEVINKGTDYSSYYDDSGDLLIYISKEIDSRNEYLIQLKEEIQKQQEEAQRLKESLGDNWDNEKWDNRVKQAEAKKKAIKDLEHQEAEVERKINSKESDLTLNQEDTQKVDTRINQLSQNQKENQAALEQLRAQRDEQQRIYNEAEAIQKEKKRRLDELNRLIAETEARESAVPETAQEKPATSSNPTESSESPLSSFGTQTADGVQQEGNEADDAASKMKALADAKKEALEANRQLAESADTTTNAIHNESDAGNFDELISKLIEAAKLLGQLPQSFEGFKGSDLTGFTEPLNNLSQAIQQLPKEGFNISLGESFDNLANRINEVLQKIQELTSQVKTAEIESNIAEKYDGQIKQLNEQINQLKADAEEAKKVLVELQAIKQNNTAISAETQKDVPKIDPLAEDYKSLKQAQENVFKATNVEEYNTALKEAEDILQRIINTLQSRVTEQSPLLQTDYLIQGYGEDPYDAISTEALTKSVLQKANIENMQTASAKSVQAFVEQQKKALQSLEDSLKDIELIPVEKRSNWDQEYIDKYASIARSAEEATAVIQILKDTLAQIETTGLDQNTLQSFLEFGQYGSDQIATVQTENSTFNSNTKTIANEYVSKLTEIEKRLEKIKADSRKLINIDSTTSNALIFVEKYLNRIKELKETIDKDPLEVYNPSFTKRADSTFTELVNTKDEDSGQSMLEEMEQISARSQTDLKRMTTNYNSYATALKKLFDDMSKGAGVSLKQLEEDLKRVNELATKLANSTGLERNNLLTGELNPKADPKVADAQAGAANKVAIAYESMFTKIESEARTAQSTIEEIFGIKGVAKGLDARFVEGSVEGFNDFVQNANQAGEALKRLKEIQESIGNDKNWVTQEENVKEYQQTVKTLNESLKQVAENASKFSVTDELDVQKLRASTTQFIKDNPALSGGDVSQLEGFIDQLQGKINSVDFTAIKNGIEGVKQTAIEAGRTGDTFFSMLTQRFKSLGAYLLSFVSFYEVIGVFKQGINIVHELDDALTEMQKVSDESLSSLREYQKGTFDTADKIGTTAAQLQQSTADWMRLGEDLQTASQSAQTANVLFNVSEFDNINDATTALVAMSAAYADAEKGIEKMDIVDRLNLIGNNYAIATDELATALQDGAATLQTAGNDLDQAIALTTAGNLITQDASKTGK